MTRKYSVDEFVQEFWNKVDMRGPDECWEWTAGSVKGYGVVGWNGKHERSHRVSYVLANGEIPNELLVLHKCDNPLCVNPSHLFLGTDGDNAKDRDEKNRGPRGERHGKAKLTEENVVDIRNRYANGEYTYEELSEMFEVGKSEIAHIVTRISWKHI